MDSERTAPTEARTVMSVSPTPVLVRPFRSKLDFERRVADRHECQLDATTQPLEAQDTIAWGATDPAGISSYDVEVALNDAPWTPWLTGTTSTAATYNGTPGNHYRFRVRARDGLGNQSPFSTTPMVTIARPPTATPPARRPPRGRSSAGLALTNTTRIKRTLRIRGRLHPRATGTVRVRLTARRKRRTKTIPAANGAFGTAITVPRAARKAKRATLTLRYSGDANFLPASRRLTIRMR